MEEQVRELKPGEYVFDNRYGHPTIFMDRREFEQGDKLVIPNMPSTAGADPKDFCGAVYEVIRVERAGDKFVKQIRLSLRFDKEETDARKAQQAASADGDGEGSGE